MSKDIRAGQLIELEYEESDGSTMKFKTIIDDVVNEDTMFLYTPMYKGKAYNMTIGATITILYSVFNKSTNKDDVFAFKAELITKQKKGNITLIKVRKTSEAKIIQRRGFYRLNLVKKMGITYFIDGEPVEAEMLSNDISSGGMKFLFTRKLEKGEMVTVHIPLSDDEENEEKFDISGEVIHCEPEPESIRKFDTRILFKGNTAKVKSQLTSYIFSLQAKYLKKIAYDQHEKNMNEVFKKNLYKGPDKRKEKDAVATWVDYSKILSFMILFLEIGVFLMSRPRREFPVARFFNLLEFRDWNVGLFLSAAILNIVVLMVSSSGLYCNTLRNKRSTDYISKTLIGLVIFTILALLGFVIGLGSII